MTESEGWEHPNFRYIGREGMVVIARKIDIENIHTHLSTIHIYTLWILLEAKTGWLQTPGWVLCFCRLDIKGKWKGSGFSFTSCHSFLVCPSPSLVKVSSVESSSLVLTRGASLCSVCLVIYPVLVRPALEVWLPIYIASAAPFSTP